MKIITTIGRARTGSTYFHQHIKPVEDITFNAMEFFVAWNMTHFKRVVTNTFFKYDIPFTEAYKRYFSKLLNGPIKDGNFPAYNYQMLLDVIEILRKEHYKYFFHKVIPTNWVSLDHPTLYSNIIDISDRLIVNYRKNILDVFISRQRSQKTRKWTRIRKYDPIYDQEFTWNKWDFLTFSENYISFYDDVLNLIKSHDMKYNIIYYEKLIQSSEKERMEIISKAIGHEHPLKQPIVKKQSRIIKQVDAFSNKEQFLSEYETIDEYYKTLNLT